MDLNDYNSVSVQYATDREAEDYCFAIRKKDSDWVLLVELVDVGDSVDEDVLEEHCPSTFFGNIHYAGISTDPEEFTFDHTMVNKRHVEEIDSPHHTREGNHSEELFIHQSSPGSAGEHSFFLSFFLGRNNH